MDFDIPQSLPYWPKVTGRSIVADSFARELASYRERHRHHDTPVWLDLPQLEEALQSGAVRFGSPDLAIKAIDDKLALRAAIEAVQDGIVLMFVDQLRVDDLDKPISLHSESIVRFIKLTALRGY